MKKENGRSKEDRQLWVKKLKGMAGCQLAGRETQPRPDKLPVPGGRFRERTHFSPFLTRWFREQVTFDLCDIQKVDSICTIYRSTYEIARTGLAFVINS